MLYKTKNQSNKRFTCNVQGTRNGIECNNSNQSSGLHYIYKFALKEGNRIIETWKGKKNGPSF